MRKKCVLCVLLLCGVLFGCASNLPVRTAVSRETTLTDYPIQTPRPEGYGTVCIYRPKGFAGCGAILIHHDFAVIGASSCGTYAYYHLPAGKQTIWAEFTHRGTIDVDMRPGETIYLLFDLPSDFLEGSYPKFTVVPETQAKAEMAGFKYISYKPLR